MDDVQTARDSGAAAEAAPLLARIAALGPGLAAAAAEADRICKLTDHQMAALHDAGLFRLLLPQDLGGIELPLPAFFQVVEKLASFDASAAWCVVQGNGCAMLGAYLDPAVGREIWADDPRAVLAWGPGKAEARAVDGGYRVTARLAFVSGGRHATWFGVHCAVLAGDGSPRLNAAGVAENRTMLIPASAATMTAIWDVIGLRGTGSDAVAVDDLFVAEDHSIVRATMIAGRRCHGPLYAVPQMGLYAIGFAATALGIARGFLDAFLVLAREKKPRLVTVPICENPVVQDEVARAEARIAAARAWLQAETTTLWDEVVATGKAGVPQRMRVRLAATHAIHEAKAAVDVLYDTAGTDAIFAKGPFERRLRDIRTVSQQIQGRKTHFASVGAWLLGHPADMSVI